ncbi:MAG: hypothetical protein ACLQBK_19940, partial [Candidatus Sulfotelmatobacter sp.]
MPRPPAQAQSAVSDEAATASQLSQSIPHSYFGMHLMDPADWPAGQIGSLGKASASYWPYLEPAKGVFDWS